MDLTDDWIEESLQQEQGTPQSIHALLRQKGKIYGESLSILHDDNSSHDFISEKLVRKLGLSTVPSSYKIKATFQGTHYNGTREIKSLEISIGAYTERHDFLIAPLQSTAAIILGMLFCHQHNPRIDYNTHTQ